VGVRGLTLTPVQSYIFHVETSASILLFLQVQNETAYGGDVLDQDEEFEAMASGRILQVYIYLCIYVYVYLFICIYIARYVDG